MRVATDSVDTQGSNPVLTLAVLVRSALGWAAVAGAPLIGSVLGASAPTPMLVAALVVVVVVILVCAFGVVHEAERLARTLGDPYGSLILTLSIVLVEVILIVAVMLGPGEHGSIGRDSVLAVAMIILNGVIGAALVTGGLRHGGLRHRPQGSGAYLALLVALCLLAFGLPAVIGENGSYGPGQAAVVAALAVTVYIAFLWRQTGAQSDDFREPVAAAEEGGIVAAPRVPIATILREHRRELTLRAGVLIVTVIPIVLLSHELASLVDEVLARSAAPAALAGVIIAAIVFLPETITTLRAAYRGQLQRVVNLCHGALVSTLGLTIPAVLTVGAITAAPVILAPPAAELLLIGASLLLTAVTFSARQVGAIHGFAHLALFAAYGLVLLA